MSMHWSISAAVEFGSKRSRNDPFNSSSTMRPSSISSRLAIALHICHAHGVAFSVRLPSSLKAGFSPFIRPKIAALSCL